MNKLNRIIRLFTLGTIVEIQHSQIEQIALKGHPRSMHGNTVTLKHWGLFST